MKISASYIILVLGLGLGELQKTYFSFLRREGSKIAEVTLKGVSEGPALVAIHLEGVKSLYLTVNVLSADDCSLKMLRVEASLRKDSYFRTLCSSMSRECNNFINSFLYAFTQR